MSGNGEVDRSNILAKIQTQKKEAEVCHDDSARPVSAQTIEELHSLQRKKSAPNTHIKGAQPQNPFSLPPLSELDSHKQQLQSISASLASLTRESGPNLVRGDPARKSREAHPFHCQAPVLNASDSTSKFTHILHNLSPAELYEQAIKYEHGSFITSSGALATLSGAKTGRSPRDKRVIKDQTTEHEL